MSYSFHLWQHEFKTIAMDLSIDHRRRINYVFQGESIRILIQLPYPSSKNCDQVEFKQRWELGCEGLQVDIEVKDGKVQPNSPMEKTKVQLNKTLLSSDNVASSVQQQKSMRKKKSSNRIMVLPDVGEDGITLTIDALIKIDPNYLSKKLKLCVILKHVEQPSWNIKSDVDDLNELIQSALHMDPWKASALKADLPARTLELNIQVEHPLQMEFKMYGTDTTYVVIQMKNTHDALGIEIQDLEFHMDSTENYTDLSNHYRGFIEHGAFPISIEPLEVYCAILCIEEHRMDLHKETPRGTFCTPLTIAWQNKVYMTNPIVEQHMVDWASNRINRADTCFYSISCISPVAVGKTCQATLNVVNNCSEEVDLSMSVDHDLVNTDIVLREQRMPIGKLKSKSSKSISLHLIPLRIGSLTIPPILLFDTITKVEYKTSKTWLLHAILE